MTAAATHDGPALRLSLARACAWALLLTGWVGLGGISLVLAPGVFTAFALTGAWLLALGLAATIATRDSLPARGRQGALLACAVLAAGSLAWTTRGGGMAALLLALVLWSILAALASGVVRGLRLAQAVRPGPPVAAAAFGAACSALVLGRLDDPQALTLRLGVLVLAVAAILAVLQEGASRPASTSRCRAGLFDCSLPAWPAGAWSDLRQWPVMLAGLAMLPMMAALPLTAAWCRAGAIAPQFTVLLHFAAMFAPALLGRRAVAGWTPRRLRGACALLLAAGGAAIAWIPAPWNMLGLALAHGAAWGLAWTGQLWSPDLRGRQGTSPLRAAIGYAALTLVFGAVVAWLGAVGVVATHAALAGVAVLAWGLGSLPRANLDNQPG